MGTVAEMLVRMSAAELEDWRDFYAAEAALERAVTGPAKIPLATAQQAVWSDPDAEPEDD